MILSFTAILLLIPSIFNLYNINTEFLKLRDINEINSNYYKDLKNMEDDILEIVSNNDENLLKKLTDNYYSLYEGLYRIGYNIVQGNNSELQITNQTLIDKANKLAECPKNCKYGIGENEEIEKRNLVGSTTDLFESQFGNKYHEYSFLATSECNMYFLMPQYRQDNLVSGKYTTHPWCKELKNNDKPNRAYATETYLTKNILRPYSSIVFPIKQVNNMTAFFGLGLNLYNMTIDFYNANGLTTDNARLFLVANHTNPSKNFVNISEPRIKFPEASPVENTPLTSLDSKEQDIFIKKLSEFDKTRKSNFVTIDGRNYFISASTNNLAMPDQYPIKDNEDREVTWEWVLLRPSALQTSGSNLNIDLIQFSLLAQANLVLIIITIILGITILAITYSTLKFVDRIRERRLQRTSGIGNNNNNEVTDEDFK